MRNGEKIPLKNDCSYRAVPMPPSIMGRIKDFMGALMGVMTFLRSDKLDRTALRVLFPLSFLGAVAGVLVVQQILVLLSP